MERPVNRIKRAQKESLLLHEIAQLFLERALEDSELKNLFVNRIVLSESGSICTVFFYSSLGHEEFDRVFGQLKLYKPSMRKALSQKIKGRYTPDLIFRFDDQLKKQLEIEALIERVKAEDDSRYSE